jgi:hypothetical protein
MERFASGRRVSEDDPSELRKAALALAVALLALNALDLTVTMFNIENLGAIELNRLVAPLLGTPWALVLKLGIPIGIIALATRVTSVWSVNLLRVAVSIYLVVVMIGVGQLAFALV